MSGWGKAFWLILIVLLPLLGADDIATLDDLPNRGVLSEEGFDRARTQALAGSATARVIPPEICRIKYEPPERAMRCEPQPRSLGWAQHYGSNRAADGGRSTGLRDLVVPRYAGSLWR
jgi:hypothetical protein